MHGKEVNYELHVIRPVIEQWPWKCQRTIKIRRRQRINDGELLLFEITCCHVFHNPKNTELFKLTV